MNIAYEPHPVSPERKAKLRAAGFKIIDVRFKPFDAVGDMKTDALQAQAEAQAEASPPVRRRGRPRKVD